MSDEAPKSALEIAMERLRRKDTEDGVEIRPLTEEQRAAIADARSYYRAKVAETEVLHRSQLARTANPEERAKLEEEFRRDRVRLNDDCDSKVERIRRGEI